MGLWLSKIIVEAHGGLAGMRCEGLGHGCTFFFELPAYLPEGLSAIEHVPSLEEATATIAGSGINLELSRSASSYGLTNNGGDHVGESSPLLLEGHVSPATTQAEHVSPDSFATFFEAASSDSTADMAPYSLNLSASFPKNHLRVLLADDSPVTRRIVSKLILSADYSKLMSDLDSTPSEANTNKNTDKNTDKNTIVTCEYASNGQVAVDMVQHSLLQSPEQQYDVILVDYYMPILDGDEAIRQMRSLGYTGCILAVTAAGSEEQEKVLQAGATAILAKPFQLKSFLQSLQHYFDTSLHYST